MRKLVFCLLTIFVGVSFQTWGQDYQRWQYRVEAVATVGKGTYAPLWLTANRYGWGSTMPNVSAVRAGMFGIVSIQRYGHLAVGMDLSGAYHFASRLAIQQMHLDLGWKQLNLSLGMKERSPFLRSDLSLSSGTLVEDANARPVPQARLELMDYVPVPWTREWLGLKGYVAYGKFTDSDWQEDFVAAGQRFVRGAYYHSKGALLRVGNQKKRPWSLELGLQMATQFGGAQYRKTASGDAQYEFGVPIDWKTLVRVFLAMQGGGTSTRGDQLNAEGNTVGAWLGRFTYDFPSDWKLQVYAEHYFEDESEMFFQYGMWRDGLLGIDLTLPKNRWVDRVVWEGLASDDQAGPILYEWFDASFGGIQISACDNYYNHGFYGGWQHWGLGMGHPLLPGPAYDADHSIRFRSNRVRAHHIGISGSPFQDWSYRVKISFARHWGTYNQPLKEVTWQTSGLAELTWKPSAWDGWSFSGAVAADLGGLIGKSLGGMVTVKKEGILLKR